jgi:hypothetical protein
MAYFKVSKDFVIEAAKFIIVKIDQTDAIQADQIIDQLMSKRTIFFKEPIYKSRTECIEKVGTYTPSELFCAFLSRKQKSKAELLLLAARHCSEDHLYITEDNISTLGYVSSDISAQYVQHFWDDVQHENKA